MRALRPLLDVKRRRLTPFLALTLVVVLALIPLVLPGCGEDDPVQPPVSPDEKGWIFGYIFLGGDPSGTTQITVEIFENDSGEKVSTVFPNPEGRFQSDPLDPGDYYLIGSVELAGYFPEQRGPYTVLPGQGREVSTPFNPFEVRDISRPVFEDLTPEPGTPQNPTFLIDRRPVIGGTFSSEGSGFKIETFVFQLRREPDDFQRVEIGLQVTVESPGRRGSFSWQPDSNLDPGEYEAKVSMQNHAPETFAERAWSFEVLEGVTRYVVTPGQPHGGELEYDQIGRAVADANDGDTVLVAPGTHEVISVGVTKDLVFLGEGNRDENIIRASSFRHFAIQDPRRIGLQLIIKRLTFTGGSMFEPGGAIRVYGANPGVDLTIEDCVFSDNESDDRGGALALFSANARILDCVFENNRSSAHGGAIAMFFRSQVEVANCLFIRNSVSQGLSGTGGGIFFSGPVEAEIHHNTFFRNAAADGAGMYLDFDSIVGSPNVDSRSNLFLENESGQNGFTVYVNESFLGSVCDGFYRNTGGEIDGNFIRQIAFKTVVNDEDDPGYCDPTGQDLHFQPDSPFFTGECPERGAFPPGCSP